ncbi:DNA repair protein RadC [bacterium]|nr:DNA repair protein RadC [bacterium]
MKTGDEGSGLCADGGIESLPLADLLARVMGATTPRSVARARRVAEIYPTAAELAAASRAELASLPGLGTSRALAIEAAIALGRRADHRAIEPGEPITRSEAVWRHFHPRLAGLAQERFYVLLLDGKGRLLREVRVSEGSLTASLVHPREVFRRAVREAAAAVILVHNHPSGDPEPSPEDSTLTGRLRAAGELLGIRVLDHVVVGRGRWTSFADLGLL